MGVKVHLRKMNLQKKILLSNVILFALPCLVLSCQMLVFVRQEGNQRLNQSRLVILNQINKNIEVMFNNITTYSDFFFSNAEVNSLISKKTYADDYEALTIEKTMQNYLRDRWVYYGNSGYYLEILGENGSCYSSRWNEDMGPTYSDLEQLKKEEWYPRLLESSSIRYIPTNSSEEFRKDEKSAIRAVRLLKNFNSGRAIGLMDVSIQQEQLQNLFEGGVQKNQSVFLMDETGKVISCTDGSMIGGVIASPKYMTKLLDYDYGFFPASVDGTSSQICFVTNPTTGWKIVMYEDMKTGAWFINMGYAWMVFVAVIYFLLAVFMSLYNSRYISRPVQKLKEDMRIAYQGDLSVRAQVETNDEFGQLSQQFNEMIGKIQQLIRQLGERDEEKRVLELQALQAQINPHFLYNTLASIRFLLEMDMREKAEDSLMALAKLLKRTFSDYRKLIPVEEEMKSLEHYLILMENRYQDTFVWKIQMEDGAKDCLIPRLSIQPLVENAISHGFSQKECIGHIIIRAERKYEDLTISVCDDGEGADLEKIHRLLKEPSTVGQKGQVSGIGIRNVQERIQMYFGESYGLSANSLDDGGTCFNVRIPAWTEMPGEDG
ncbi:cache domain-containing sensor histidine kinase [Enterocloster clostridioformis]|uniref:Histidine kinase-, DNA gyrase B-, and HSP90-like ATPase n=1 Tax=Enterocloster clostridioformis TaxID=1531 RepID=A0A1I0JDT5_9FIRM|nr:sensor histidine kinase [Enterocloster clostridioformis]SEU08178.1 Histidine kinase-, DNA gyrase B-, and HSP90-like ATPase [Enterocloster clostridioformis]SEW45339.1 Histidine kinase-, DNA gyrase B-, and HSP90-like ATPase [Enterocloster clostridioformis]